MSNLEPLLKTGVILADFNSSGKLPLTKESLTKHARGSDMLSLIVFKMVTGTLYGPEDLLASILPIKVQTSFEVTGDKKLILSSYP